MNGFIYWVKFDKEPRPERLYVKSFEEWKDVLTRLILQYGEMPEWMVRDYGR